MSSQRAQKAKKRAKREARRQTRRAQRGTEASSTPRAFFESGEAFSPEYEDECEYIVIRVPDGIDLRISGKTATPERQLFLARP